jgi:flavin-dependent dehydrogenase
LVYDLTVIGGGPAGAAAAITAVRAGGRVLLLERGKYPRHKVCGEFVSAESLGLLASLLGEDDESGSLLQPAPRITQGRLFIDGSVLHTPIDPPAASIPRISLDAALWRTAERRGVEAHQQVTVQGIAGTEPFTITTSGASFQTRSVIDSSGRWSNLKTKGANGTGRQAKWIGIKAHFAEPQQLPPSVDLYFFQHGYCGVQPVTSENGVGEVNACAMVRADVANSLPEVFRQHAQLQERSRAWRQISDVVTTSPLVFATPEPVKDGVLRAGDAAGFVDPFVGDGISLALRSGALAAQCLRPFLEGKTELAQAAKNYQYTYQEQLAPVFRTSSNIRRLFSLPAPVRAGLLFVFENAPGLTRHLVRKTR